LTFFLRIAVLLPSKKSKMKFKNIFKNTSNMTAENTEIDQNQETITMENNATANEETVVCRRINC
jgi:molecular chaperone GrpE